MHKYRVKGRIHSNFEFGQKLENTNNKFYILNSLIDQMPSIIFFHPKIISKTF
jgi:hypothetical protein